MTAIDDYPPPHNAGGSAHEQHEQMCEEIDRLRALWNFVHAEPRNDGSDMIRFDHLRSVKP